MPCEEYNRKFEEWKSASRAETLAWGGDAGRFSSTSEMLAERKRSSRDVQRIEATLKSHVKDCQQCSTENAFVPESPYPPG
jgi:hypothetical protein